MSEMSGTAARRSHRYADWEAAGTESCVQKILSWRHRNLSATTRTCRKQRGCSRTAWFLNGPSCQGPMRHGSARLLSNHIPAHDGGLALVGEPALPGDLIEAALPQLHNLPRGDLGELLELDPITFLECGGRHPCSLRLLFSYSNRASPAPTGPAP